MAVGTATNVSAAKPNTGGAIYAGATSVQLPTSTSASIPTGMTALGYISEDGVTNTSSPTNKDVKAWGGDIVLSSQTEKKDTFSMTLLEVLNINVLKQIYGSANVTGTLQTGITVNVNANELPEQAYIVDMIMRNNTAKRMCIPRGKITEIGEVNYADGSAVGYKITITAMPDASGNTHYEYIKAATTTGSGG